MLRSKDVDLLLESLNIQASKMDFRPILNGCRRVFLEHGIDADRIQIPMTKVFGFRHPTLWGVILTWTRDGEFKNTSFMTHEDAARAGVFDEEDLTRSMKTSTEGPTNPYFFIFGDRDWFFQCDLESPPAPIPRFNKLREDGLRHYACFRLPTPASSSPAVVSLASVEPFPDDLRERLEGLRGLLALVCYASYRVSQATQIALSYVGQRTGPKVLEGQVARGMCEEIEAGIMFCDVRGFTALTQEVGAQIIPIMNEIFGVIGEEAEKRGGEILKFIGDAMLLIFPRETCSAADVAQAMVETVRMARIRVAEVAATTERAISVGFGCHLGEVIYGNIGTARRIDFTVMGAPVNLASRLESLCKPIGASGVFSEAVQEHCPELKPAGEHALKGIADPVPVWILPD